jgi:hypothetical protein
MFLLQCCAIKYCQEEIHLFLRKYSRYLSQKKFEGTVKKGNRTISYKFQITEQQNNIIF